MNLSRQEKTLGGRHNQRMRTRSAVLSAAVDLVREGRPPSVVTAAERALVSPATAYRYFPSAEDLWAEAAWEAIEFQVAALEVDQRIEAAGDDPEVRLDAVVTSIGWWMIDEPMPFRHLARAGLDRWLAQQADPSGEPVPVRQNRRLRWNSLIVAPLRDTLTDDEITQLVNALALGWGTEAAIALTDVAGLDAETAKETMLRTCRWILRSAIGDAAQGSRR